MRRIIMKQIMKKNMQHKKEMKKGFYFNKR